MENQIEQTTTVDNTDNEIDKSTIPAEQQSEPAQVLNRKQRRSAMKKLNGNSRGKKADPRKKEIHDAAQLEELNKKIKHMQNNDIYDQLNNTHMSIMTLLNKFGSVHELLNQRNILEHVTHKQILASQINTLNNDLKGLTSAVAMVYAKHKDKTGSELDIGEFMKALDLMVHYQNIMTRYNNGIEPILNSILETFAHARNKFIVSEREKGNEVIEYENGIMVSMTPEEAQKEMKEYEEALAKEQAELNNQPIVECTDDVSVEGIDASEPSN